MGSVVTYFAREKQQINDFEIIEDDDDTKHKKNNEANIWYYDHVLYSNGPWWRDLKEGKQD
jgi:hypothetical protein